MFVAWRGWNLRNFTKKILYFSCMNMYDLKPETAKQKVTGNNKKVLKEREYYMTRLAALPGQLAPQSLQNLSCQLNLLNFIITE